MFSSFTWLIISGCLFSLLTPLPISATFTNGTDEYANLQGLILIVQKGYTSIPSNETYPNDEYSVPEYWPDGYGQLTIVGKQLLFKLGQSIASKYKTVLPINPHDVYIQSFDDTPTFESAEVLSAGAFPPTERWIWNEKILWQPIKINTSPSTNDTVLGTSIPCEIPTLSNMQTREAYVQLTKAHSNLLTFVAEETGLDEMSIQQFVDLYKIIILEDNANLPRLTWLNQTIWQEMEKFVSDLAYLMYSDNLVQKTVAGPLLAQISKNIQTIQTNGSSPKVYIYVTQQPKMISLLTSLLINNTQEIVTKPGSVIGFEIYSNPEKQPYFHLTFNDGKKTEFWKPLAMYGCDLDCSMDHFYRFTQFVSPITAQELCSHSDGQPVTFPSIVNSNNLVNSQPAALSLETIFTEQTEPVTSGGGGWSTFLITILCLACIALIIFGVVSYIKRRRRIEYFFI